MKKIKKNTLPIIFIIILILAISGSFYIGYYGSASFGKKATTIISLFSLAGVIFSYFYSEIMKKRIALHSEAQWRPRLYNLMKKKKITYNDVLYFTAFFNVNKSKNTDIDTAVKIAIKHILDKKFDLNVELFNLYNKTHVSIDDTKQVQSLINDAKHKIKQALTGDCDQEKLVQKAIIDVEQEIKQTLTGNCDQLEQAKNLINDDQQIERVQSLISNTEQKLKQAKNLINDDQQIKNVQQTFSDAKLNLEQALTLINHATQNQQNSYDNLLGNFNTIESLNTPLEEDQIILFKACISELLKADWDKQK